VTKVDMDELAGYLLQLLRCLAGTGIRIRYLAASGNPVVDQA